VHYLQSSDSIYTNSHHYKRTLSTFTWSALCRSHKTLCWSLGSLHAHCISACPHPKSGSLGVHTSGAQKWKSEGAKSGLAGVWGLGSSYSLAGIFEFFSFLTSLMSANIPLSWLWDVSSRISLTSFLRCLSKESAMTLSLQVCSLNLFFLFPPTAPI